MFAEHADSRNRHSCVVLSLKAYLQKHHRPSQCHHSTVTSLGLLRGNRWDPSSSASLMMMMTVLTAVPLAVVTAAATMMTAIIMMASRRNAEEGEGGATAVCHLGYP